MSDQPDWAEQARRLMVGLSGMFSGDAQMAAGPEPAPLAGDCRWCPLCQAAAVLRGERPEVSAAMADVLATASAALRSFAGQTEESGPAGAAGSQPDAGGQEPAGPAEAAEAAEATEATEATEAIADESDTGEPEPPGGAGSGVQRIEIA